jgi:integrase/recombinase XerD
LATGNRLGTVCELRVKDIDFDSNVIHLRKVKTRKAYNIPLSSALEKILAEYMQFRKGEGEDYLFCNKYGDKLLESSLNTAIYRYNRKKGVSKTSIHLYRNTFAKIYLTYEGDIARLQKLLGHSTPTMSLKYAKMFDKDLNHHFDERNPLDTHMKNVKKNEAIKMTKIGRDR